MDWLAHAKTPVWLRTSSSFPTMRRQVTVGTGTGFVGSPGFTTDIGGFGGRHVDHPAFHELLL